MAARSCAKVCIELTDTSEVGRHSFGVRFARIRAFTFRMYDSFSSELHVVPSWRLFGA